MRTLMVCELYLNKAAEGREERKEKKREGGGSKDGRDREIEGEGGKEQMNEQTN